MASGIIVGLRLTVAEVKPVPSMAALKWENTVGEVFNEIILFGSSQSIIKHNSTKAY